MVTTVLLRTVAKAINRLRATPNALVNTRDVHAALIDDGVHFALSDLREAVYDLRDQGCFSAYDNGTVGSPVTRDNITIHDFEDSRFNLWLS